MEKNSTPTPSPTPAPTNTPTATPTPTKTPTATLTPTPTTDPWVIEQMTNMSLQQKIGQMLMIGVDGQEISPATCSLVKRLTPGAVIYRTVNPVSPDQLRRLSADLQACAESAGIIPLWIAIDHEGQYVTRFERGVTIFPAAMAQGATGDPAYANQVARAAGNELAYSGVNIVLGPVADVLTNLDNSVISQRAFGGDPSLVSQYVSQAVRGYTEAGLIPVLKHFPGHGGVAGDTHYVETIDTASVEELEQTYLPPFAAGIEAGAPVVMFSHVSYPNIDYSVVPATISPAVVSILRDDMGFEGVILTDSMGMRAITGEERTLEDASVQAVQAGINMLLVASPSSAEAAFNSLVNAVQSGEIPLEHIDESVIYILRTKADRGLKSHPLTTSDAPDWQGNKELAFDVGYKSATIVRDNKALVPLPPAPRHILVIGPTDGWGLYPALGKALNEHGYTYQVVTYSSPWRGAIPEAAYLETLPVMASRFDLVLMFTWEAHLNQFRFNDTWQNDLVNRLLAQETPLIITALKSPTDIINFPQAPTYLATFGTTRGQTQALADILVGAWQATGQNPLPAIPAE